MKPLILIVSQDPEFFLIFSHILDADGFSCELVARNVAGRLCADKKPVAIIVDCQAEDEAAPVLCKQLKQGEATRHVPIAALVAPKADIQHLELLKAGIDECFIRPFAPAKLLAYLRTARETRRGQTDSPESLNHGGLQLDLETYRVRYGARDIHLAPIEFRLLRHLMRSPGKVFHRQELVQAAWPDNRQVDERSVDVHVAKLRKMLKQTMDKDLIRTVRSAGYALATTDM